MIFTEKMLIIIHLTPISQELSRIKFLSNPLNFLIFSMFWNFNTPKVENSSQNIRKFIL